MERISEELKELVKVSNRLQKLLKAYALLSQNAPENAYLLEKKLAEIKKVVQTLPDSNPKETVRAWLETAESDVAKAKEDFKFQFGQQLQELFKKDDRTMRGHFPLLRIGLYTLRVNFDLGEAILYFGPEVEKVSLKIPFTPHGIFSALRKYDGEVRAFKESPHELYEKLRKAYKRRLALANKAFGEKLLITEVLHEFVILQQSKKFMVDPDKSSFRAYPRVKLSYMLYYVKKSGADQSMRLHVATFDATTDKQHSVWIPDNEDGEGTHYSYISFEKHIDT